MRNIFLLFLLIAFQLNGFSQKPKVWIISDGGDNINDPDDISAIAGYLLFSNHFETKGIVLASSVYKWHEKTADQKEWAEKTFGSAYQNDLPNLNKFIGGYQKSIPFYESSVKAMGHNFSPNKKYNLNNYPSILALYKELKHSNNKINVLCFGPLTEQAILVKHCICTNKTHLLKKVRFIGHWTSSNYHTGTLEHPERTHNCVGDPVACAYIKEQAMNGSIEYFECGAIGQFGVVEGSPSGKEYYQQFEKSNLGRLFYTGKFRKGRVDDSDCATYLVLLGNYNVSLHDISSSGINFPDVEKENEKKFFTHAKDIRKEMLRRSNAASGIYTKNYKPEYKISREGRIVPFE